MTGDGFEAEAQALLFLGQSHLWGHPLHTNITPDRGSIGKEIDLPGTQMLS